MLEGMAKESSYEVSWTCLGDGWKVCDAAARVRDTKTLILGAAARLYCKGAAARAARSYKVRGGAASRYTYTWHIHILCIGARYLDIPCNLLHAAGLWIF